MPEEKRYNFKINENYTKEGTVKKKGANKKTKSSTPSNSKSKSFESIKSIRIKDILVRLSPDIELVKKCVFDYSNRHCFFAPVYVTKKGKKYYAEGNVEIIEAAKSLGLGNVFCKYGTKADAEKENEYRKIGTFIKINNEIVGKVFESTEKEVWVINQSNSKIKYQSDFLISNNAEIIEIESINSISSLFKDKDMSENERFLQVNHNIINEGMVEVTFKGIKSSFYISKLIFFVKNCNKEDIKIRLMEVKIYGQQVIKEVILSGEEKGKENEIYIPNILNVGAYNVGFYVKVGKKKRSDEITVNLDFDADLIEVKNEPFKIEPVLKELEKPIKKNNIIDARSFVIRSNTYNECVGHNVENVNATIDVFDGKEIKEVNVQAYYCFNCGIYYLNEHEYLRIRRYGNLICQVLSIEEYKKLNNKAKYKLNPESILKKFGYSANQKDNLSEKQRRAILEMMIEKNVLTKYEIIEYLRFFIRYHSHASYAIKKWQSDISYLNGYSKGNPQYVKITKIVR